MKSWKTTVGGILAALGTVVTLLPLPYCSIIGPALTAAGQAFLGITAADKSQLKH